MKDLTAKFGQDAGKIWIVLNEKGPLTRQEIQAFIKLNDDEFFAGVGWLAREDKISVGENSRYKLSNTNLAQKVGTVTGKIWKILDIWEEADISTIKRLSQVDEPSINLAIGWLAREEKICMDDKQKFSLK